MNYSQGQDEKHEQKERPSEPKNARTSRERKGTNYEVSKKEQIIGRSPFADSNDLGTNGTRIAYHRL